MLSSFLGHSTSGGYPWTTSKTFLLIAMVCAASLLLLVHVLPCTATAKLQQQQQAPCKATGQASRGDDIRHFLATARQQLPVTDKVTAHQYHLMYGTFLSRLRDAPVKMLEIGLGCNMHYGPGSSVKLWKSYLHKDSSIWMAEVDAACLEKHRMHSSMQGVNVLVGDQANRDTLRSWIKQAGTDFDVIVDDGGHTNLMIKNSFDLLWPTVKPGGMYFIEDLQVCRSTEPWQNKLPDGRTMSDVIQAWIEALLVGGGGLLLPDKLESILCQREACVLLKSYDLQQ